MIAIKNLLFRIIYKRLERLNDVEIKNVLGLLVVSCDYVAHGSKCRRSYGR